MRKATVVWLAAATLLLTSCGGTTGPESPDGTDAADTAPDSSPTVTVTQTTTVPADGTPDGSGNGADASSCEVTEDWTLLPDVKPGSSGDPIREVRTGRHDCFDRVVFDIHGTDEVGFDVQYQPEVRQPGSGRPMPVAGDAALRVIVRSSAQGAPGSGSEEPLAAMGEHFVPESELADWGALRSVRYAGWFEGQVTFALGVREELPFRAFTWLNEDRGVREVVVDIAHDPN